MSPFYRLAALVAAASAIATPLHAASGGIDSFSASATTVTVGDTVDFFVQFSISTNNYYGGGSNPFEPAPTEGYQDWYVNWASWERESLNTVWLQASGAGFYEAPGLPAGSGYSNGWMFSVTFTEAGSHSMGVTGGWDGLINTGYSRESASRNCYVIDPDTSTDLVCDSWRWSYSDYDATYGIGGDLSAGSLNIEVMAVPEPATWALWLAGAGLLIWRPRARR